MPNFTSDGEAEDFRRRLAATEDKLSEVDMQLRVHEAKCAARSNIIMIILTVIVALILPGALPKISELLLMIK